MRTIFTFLLFAIFTLGLKAQLTTALTFETGMADTSWTIFANGAGESDDDITMSANPNKMEPNLSDSCLKFVVHADASPWAGMFTDYLEEPMVFTADAKTLTMMVYKSIISPSAMKIESSRDGGSNQELKVENTLIDEWELLTFEMPEAVGFSYNRLTVFPDFPAARTEESVTYMDNFSSPGTVIAIKQLSGVKTILYPNPVENVLFVQHPEMTGFTVSNLLGQSMKTSKFQSANSKFIELSELKAGVYVISIESASGYYTSKFIKK